MVIAVVCTILVVAFAGVAAVSYFRSSVSRNLESQLYDLQLINLAESAISEVADQTRLSEIYGGPAGEVLARSLREGKLTSGVLVPAPNGTIEVVPTVVKEAFSAVPGISISAVRVVPMGYMINLKKGLLRFLVTTTIRGPQRTFQRRLAQDYEFSLFDAGGKLGIWLSKAPASRIYQ